MNVLGVGAHFDDLELGCSGTLIKHVKNNDKVYMLVVTKSAYKNANNEQIRRASIAREEGQKAAEKAHRGSGKGALGPEKCQRYCPRQEYKSD